MTIIFLLEHHEYLFKKDMEMFQDHLKLMLMVIQFHHFIQ